MRNDMNALYDAVVVAEANIMGVKVLRNGRVAVLDHNVYKSQKKVFATADEARDYIVNNHTKDQPAND